jgi:hypothetical protein
MPDKFDRFRNLDDIKEKEIEQLIKEAPDICPILGFCKCDSYYFDEGIVYLSNPAYNAYSIPEWNKDERTFDFVDIDMDDEFRRTDVSIELDELLEEGWTIEELEKLYGIKIA